MVYSCGDAWSCFRSCGSLAVLVVVIRGGYNGGAEVGGLSGVVVDKVDLDLVLKSLVDISCL